MNKIAGLCVAAIVGLGLGGAASAQNIEILPPDAPPDRNAPAPPAEPPPDVTPAPPSEGTPAPPQDGTPAPPPDGEPAAAPPEAAAAAPPAMAAAFGDAWHYAISLERIAGYDHISETQSVYGSDARTSASNFSLFGAPTTGALAAFSFPRAAFDLFLAQDFSVGLALGALYGSISATPSGSTNSIDQSFIGVLAAPRVGYAVHLAPDITLWARGGVSIIYARVNPGAVYGTDPASSHLVAATIELPFVFTILPRLALTAGPTLDVTFSGRLSRATFGGGGDAAYDTHVTELGIQGGVLVHL